MNETYKAFDHIISLRYWILGCFNGSVGLTSFASENSLMSGLPTKHSCSPGRLSESIMCL